MPFHSAAIRPLLRALALVLMVGSAAALAAADLTAVRLTTTTFAHPVCLAFAPGDAAGAKRLYVVEKENHDIWIVVNGVVRAQPFMTLPVAVGGTSNEGGLLSLAFDPDFATNHLFYLYYADTSDHDVVDRYTATADGNGVDLASRVNLLSVPRQQGSNIHYGSWMGFNPRAAGDAARRHHLYITFGESGNANAAQDVTTLLGKVARIDVDPAVYPIPGGAAYGVPGDNPVPARAPGFANAPANARGEILALGLRNPWRASFDRGTGDLLIGNVGDHGVGDESIFVVPFGTSGQNFRWPVFHGDTASTNTSAQLTWGVPTGSATTFASGAAIGGYVYRGTRLTGWQGPTCSTTGTTPSSPAPTPAAPWARRSPPARTCCSTPSARSAMAWVRSPRWPRIPRASSTSAPTTAPTAARSTRSSSTAR